MKPSASSCSQNAGSSSGPSPGSGDAEGWPRTGNVSTAKRSLSSSSLLFASCFESYAIQDDVPGQILRRKAKSAVAPYASAEWPSNRPDAVHKPSTTSRARLRRRNGDLDCRIRPKAVAIRSMTFGIPVADAALYLVEKVEAAHIRQVSEVAN